MKKPTPTDVVSEFSFDEMFFSRTDRKGVIDYGNQVFVRVSGYQLDDLVGRPHNLVRHPDMPKAVFKMFWDSLHRNEPIIAYVKNLSESGAYYWVLAAAFPIADGYLSIRIKPSSEYFGAARALYEKVLATESADGVDPALELLNTSLKDLGFPSYSAFMTTALLAEIAARDSHKGEVSQKKRAKIRVELQETSELCEIAAGNLRDIFHMLHRFSSAYGTFQSETQSIYSKSHDLPHNVLNMTITAIQSGGQGNGVAVIATEFQKTTESFLEMFRQFQERVDLTQSISQSQLNIGCVRLQIDMINFFILNEPNTDTIISEVLKLTQMALHYISETKNRMERLKIDLRDYINTSNDIKKTFRSLRVLCHTGAIESAQTSSREVIDAQLTRLVDFVSSSSKSIENIERNVKSLTMSLYVIEEKMARCSDVVALGQSKVQSVSKSAT